MLQIFSGQFNTEAQQFVVEYLLSDSIIQEYPPAKSYVSSFIRECIRAAENQSHELHETLLDAYMTCLELMKVCYEYPATLEKWP